MHKFPARLFVQSTTIYPPNRFDSSIDASTQRSDDKEEEVDTHLNYANSHTDCGIL